MVEQEKYSFSKFYLHEFYNAVDQNAKTRFAKNRYNALNSLINNLKSEKNYSAGIELLARDHGTSELSIFLYDIMDRINDYPPTMVYDSMPEMVEDFINTLEVMLEDEKTLTSLEKVNSSFKDEVANSEIEPVTEYDVESQEDQSEKINFYDFVNIEFRNTLKTELNNSAKSGELKNLEQFSDIVLQNLQSPQLLNAPEPLIKITDILNNIFVQPGSEITSIDVNQNIKKLTPILVKELLSLEAESPETITESLNNNTLIIVEPEEKSADIEKTAIEEPVLEEILDDKSQILEAPEKVKEKSVEKKIDVDESASIETLLSAYFQSDIDEYCNIFANSFENFKNNPEDISELENLETKLHSFKEISMIHGYELFEFTCVQVMQLLKKIRTKNQSITPEFFDAANDLIAEFKNSKIYRGKNRNSDEAAQLDLVIFNMKNGIVKAEKKKIAPKDISEQVVAEEKVNDLISFNDKDSLFTIFKNLWFDLQPFLFKKLLEDRNIENSLKIFKKLNSSAALIDQKDISHFCDNLISRMKSLEKLSTHEINNGCAILFIVQENVLSNLQPVFDIETAETELNKFDSIFDNKISIRETDKLLSIILNIEKENKTVFKDRITNNDNLELEHQINHFKRLVLNLELLGLTKFRNFPDFLIEYFSNMSANAINNKIANEIDQSYKLFIENLENNKSESEINNLVSTLEEVILEYSSKLKDEKSVKKDEVEEEIPEEDLEQIFKDETKNYIWKIEDALALLETDLKHTKPFEEIEKNAHSLKASARLMGYSDITRICSHIESISDLYLNNDIQVDPELIESIKYSVNAVIAHIDGDDKDLLKIEPELSKREDILKKQVELKVEEKQEKPGVSEVEEAPLFTESDADEDLLEIFKEESASFISVLDNTIENLKKGKVNTEEIHQFEYASHSLKTAAKMLGFREIGQIADGLEKIAESLYKGEIQNSSEVTKSLDRSIKAIKVLSAGEKMPASEISDIINLLDSNQIKKEQEKTGDSGTADKIKMPTKELDPMVDLFLKEAWEMIEKINRDLVRFENNHEIAILENLNRNVHTLKGSAQMMQFEKIGHITHIVEDFLDQQIENKDTIPDDQLEPIFNAFDEIQNIMESIKNGEGEISDNYELILRNLGKIQTEGDTAAKIEEKKIIEEKSQEIDEPNPTESVAISDTQIISTKSKVATTDENSQQIKISTDRVDNLINMAAELVINKTQLINYVDSLKKLGLDLDKDRRILKDAEYSLDDIILKRKYEQELKSASELDVEGKNKFSDLALISNDFKKTINTIDKVSSKFNNLTHGFEQNINRLAHLIKMMHDDVLQVRMVSVENLFNRYPRAVRDLAKKQKKKVELVIEGTNTEMDRAMIESLSDPVMHLVRNAVDHGIELPMHRKNASKDNVGKLFLRAKQDKNQIIIEIEDDGKGINVDAVKETIIKKKILEKDKVEMLSRGEVLDYIFYPGFSTKKETSNVSGRGIGLDVVASQVEKLKGDIRVNSTIGQGTTFSIRVPLTLIISQAMLFKLTDQILAVPVISVEESIQFDSSAIISENGKMYIHHRGEKISALNLNSLLNFSDFELKGELKAIIIQETGIRCALIVDELMQREEIVIKSLGSHLENLEFISGGTILGDGTIALILDTTAIIRKIEKETLKKDKVELKEAPQKIQPKIEKAPAIKIDKKEILDRKPIALIVDDSVSVRRFVANTLEKNNYETVLANDGINALEELDKKSFDIVITDLEMPKMHGYELIEKIREQKKLKDLPIVILTGRAGKKHKDMGIKLGANAFIVKPFKDNDLLSALNEFIVS